MRLQILSLAIVIGCLAGCSSTDRPKASAPHVAETRSAVPPEALSNLNHAVATTSAGAQRHFNDGLTLVYAFNHDEAVRSFKKALEADPNLAMAHWGIALAVGPNYNVPVDLAREKQGYEEIQKAIELSAKSPAQEKAYIAALAKRFSNAENPDLNKLAAEYAEAMGVLARQYPDDLDAATLYADAMMNLRPWMLWSRDYQPAEGTDRIVATLESVLARDPDHVGANHLYIHAVEASRQPQRALEAAARLPGLAPSCGHLVHMPSHIYARVGDYESASTSNEAAVAADREYLAANPDMNAGVYAMMYYNHNMHFLAYSEAWQGNFAESKRWADALYAHASPHAGHMPGMEGFTTVPIAVLVRFRRWNDILSLAKPNESMPVTTALWHFARGMALADKGDIPAATAERTELAEGIAKFTPETMYAMLNPAANVLGVGQLMLDAKIAAAQKQYREAERLLRQAVELDDKLNYMEPPDWLLPPRETLGGILLFQSNAAEAEKVFREDLNRNPRSARSLFGLWESLEAQGKPYDADLVHRQFDAVWKNADIKLKVADL